MSDHSKHGGDRRPNRPGRPSSASGRSSGQGRASSGQGRGDSRPQSGRGQGSSQGKGRQGRNVTQLSDFDRPYHAEPRESFTPEKVADSAHTLFVATTNPGKAAELESMLSKSSFRIVGPDLIRDLQAPVEDGATFVANAQKKAFHYSRMVDHLVIADDSGLAVDALDGKPGIRSARLGGASATDADRNRLVLRQLDGVDWDERTARFHCAIAIGFNGEVLETFEATVEGRIVFEPEGSEGFGYDPLFFYEPMRRTFADMTSEEKHSVSHRGQALREAVAWLETWAATRPSPGS